VVSPDALESMRDRAPGIGSGTRPRRSGGAGLELHQLRDYAPGDPPSRIDWKATARVGRLITRQFSEDQHLDIMVAVDSGRLSHVRAGRLERLGLYVAACAPGRGRPAATRIRRLLEQTTFQSAESDLISAAAYVRRMLRHRALIVLLTAIDGADADGSLAAALRLLSPPHLVLIAGVQDPQLAELSQREARAWHDPWISLAAQEHAARAASQRQLLRRLGAQVLGARPELLEPAVLARYELLRRTRRV
jgi:uncharacterized protein (DUF58 family)